MLKTILPEQAGIPSKAVYQFLRSLVKRKLPLHSVLVMKGDSLILEAYWKPFHKDHIHRMYSTTKSFVAVAVGLAQEDGLIDLKKPITAYFPEKVSKELNPEVMELTVEQMLMMTTAGGPENWFNLSVEDRTAHYLKPHHSARPAGTRWKYDSAGSQVLCALVEKVTGKKLLDYLKERIFDHMGAFQNARMLQIQNGDSWGDSALLCTSRDLCMFDRFVMNYGTWNGKQLMNEQFLRTATARLADNTLAGFCQLYHHGYGYQFWRTEGGGFATIGMGGQVSVCLPHKDLALVFTADLQGIAYARDYIIAQFLDLIADFDPSTQDYNQQLQQLVDSLELVALEGQADSPIEQSIDGVSYTCRENPLGWKSFTVHFEGNGGRLVYQKDSGEKVLPFLMNKNCFCKFPEEGYSGQFGAQKTTGMLYDAAVSCAWVQDNKLLFYVQIIDDYFGNLLLEISFKDDYAVVVGQKQAEDFMNDYNGEIVAVRSK